MNSRVMSASDDLCTLIMGDELQNAEWVGDG